MTEYPPAPIKDYVLYWGLLNVGRNKPYGEEPMKRDLKTFAVILAALFMITAGSAFSGEKMLLKDVKATEMVEVDWEELYGAVRGGRKAEIEKRISKGLNVKTPNPLLHWAAQEGQKEIVKLLITKGADVSGKGFREETPLHNAKSNDVAELLIAHGADLEAKDMNGQTPLFHARTIEIAILLIAKGADINVRDVAGNTSLHAARSIEIAEMLIKKGVDVNAKNQWAQTRLSQEAYSGNKDMIEMLIAKGADINVKDFEGRTPLYQTVMPLIEGEKTAELLISSGADVNVKDKNGVTPLGLAIKNRKNKVADLFRTHGAKE
jgi:cytohesin